MILLYINNKFFSFLKNIEKCVENKIIFRPDNVPRNRISPIEMVSVLN